MDTPIHIFSFAGGAHLPPSQLRINYARLLILPFVVLPFFLGIAAAGCSLLHGAGLDAQKFIICFQIVLALDAGACAVISYYLGRSVLRPFNHETHIEGRYLVESDNAPRLLAAELAADIKQSGCGIEIAPGVPISLDRETKGVLLVGSPGSGKTVIIKSLLKQIAERGDRALIYDPKGDFATGLLSLGQKFIYLAPWTKETRAIDFCKDIRTLEEAQQFAATVIPKPDRADVNWALGAQALLTGILVYCQRLMPDKWTLTQLATCLDYDLATLRSILKDTYKQAYLVIEGDGKTTESYLSMLRTSCQPLLMLARSFAKVSPARTHSLRDWTTDENPERKIIVLGGSKEFNTLAQTVAQFAIGRIANTLAGLPDSRKRRLWFVLDEFPQLGKLDALFNLIEFCRSKGGRVVIGMQDLSQIEHVYSREQSQALQSMISSHIYCAVSGGKTADEISKKIGNRVVERLNINVSSNAQGLSNSSSHQRETIPVVHPSALQTDLGRGRVNKQPGIFALIDILGTSSVYKIFYPFQKFGRTQTDDQRGTVKAGVPATADKVKVIKRVPENIHRPTFEQIDDCSNGKIILPGAAAATVEQVVSVTPAAENTERTDDFNELTKSIELDVLLSHSHIDAKIAAVIDVAEAIAEEAAPKQNNLTINTTRKKRAQQKLKELEDELEQ